MINTYCHCLTHKNEHSGRYGNYHSCWNNTIRVCHMIIVILSLSFLTFLVINVDNDQNTGHTFQLSTDSNPETESMCALKGKTLNSVTIHRAVLKEELTETFKDPSIMDYDLDFTVIDNNGKEKEGKGSGESD